ncbi:unnamed protein product [Oikopleura dioica]|uniref:Uncharacterized protein n=1 Tax=Oikopleura dioica TaxID=34765 RepID=E4XFB3_OIKDI|nr:unnamed protein product [Oikopleura dioica]
MCGKKSYKKDIVKVEVNESIHKKVKIENIKKENVSDEEDLSDDAIFECLKNDLLVGTSSTYENLMELQEDLWNATIEGCCDQIRKDEEELKKYYEKSFDEIFPPIARVVKK